MSARLLGQHADVLAGAGADVAALSAIEAWALRSVVVPEGARVVDAHVHLGVDRDGHVLSAADLVADMDACGVDAAVAFPADEPGPGGDFREANARVLDAAAQFPDRIVPFCRVDPARGADRAMAEAHDAGARGLKLHPVAQRFHPEGAECVAAVRAATDLGWPVLFHAGFGARPLAPAFAALIEAVPDCRIILAHGGRGDHRALAAATAGHAGVLFDSSIAALPDLVTLPPERIAFGSDRPYGDHAQALHLVGTAARVAGWDATAMSGVLGGNLLRWIGPVQP